MADRKVTRSLMAGPVPWHSMRYGKVDYGPPATKQMLTELDPTPVSDASACPNALGSSTVGEIFGFQTLCHRV